MRIFFTYDVNKIVLILLEMNVCNSFYNSRKKIKIKKKLELL